ncbi:hypothetical protein K432DRAFT_412745 [Lepidopterella palustris CBS 459.81]|uniref:Centromere protein H C-terminal domain-containing protein n=1 Tax=Lepidopterella palustris CBS 459.81 TaxID=1314670 RepID=A0A8E2EMH7_9PEZI|nr:hypothetical protein K432DRAFT_412745 [Lepidopterella palustris CBS 459.81]
MDHTGEPAPLGSTSQPSPFSELINTTHSDAFALSDQERLILELYDQEQEIQLESISDDALQEQLIIAEREALEARTEYLLRNRITQNLMITDPVLKAVHGGSSTTLAERRLLPLINERDILSMVHGSLTSKVTSSSTALAATEKSNIMANEKNKELAQTLLALAEKMKTQSVEEIDNEKLRAQLQELENRMRMSRRRWRIMKSIVSGMIVGSGINWAEDEVLRDLVMDDEDEIQ